MDERGLAPSTVDRPLSTVCGYYRFAHIDGRIGSNPAQYVRRPRVHASTQRGLDRGELASFLFAAERTSPLHAVSAVLLGSKGLRVNEACVANIEGLGFERGHRTLQIIGKETSRPASRSSRARHADLAIGERCEGADPAAPRRLPSRQPHRLPLSAFGRQPCRTRRRPSPHAQSGVHHGRPGRRGPLRDAEIAARHADPRTTTVYDRRRRNYDRHAAYAVVTFVTNG
jgi:hypothetical protein